MAGTLLGRSEAVAESFLRQVFKQSLFLQEMKQHGSPPKLFWWIDEEVKNTTSKCQTIVYRVNGLFFFFLFPFWCGHNDLELIKLFYFARWSLQLSFLVVDGNIVQKYISKIQNPPRNQKTQNETNKKTMQTNKNNNQKSFSKGFYWF